MERLLHTVSRLSERVRYALTLSVGVIGIIFWWFIVHKYCSTQSIMGYQLDLEQYQNRLSLLKSEYKALGLNNIIPSIITQIIDHADRTNIKVVHYKKSDKSPYFSNKSALLEIMLEGDFDSMVEFLQSLTSIKGVCAWNSYTITNILDTNISETNIANTKVRLTGFLASQASLY
ncbi:MAG TPA: hypothetical protein VHA52_10385 [Candidatus Babeliaceae bacterium]|nr:hypothetical protein [Candidatus Babeliaceae bacterium]